MNDTLSRMTHWLERISPIVRLADRSHRVENGFIEPLRVIYDHQLVLIESGDYRIVINGKAYHCPANSFIIVPPGELHITHGPQAMGRRRWVHFDWVWQGECAHLPVLTYHPARIARDIIRRPPAFIPRTIFSGTIPSPARVYDRHDALIERVKAPDGYRKRGARGIFLSLLTELLDREARGTGSDDANSSVAERVRRFLQERSHSAEYNESSIRSSIASLGLSYEHQARIFKKAYGVTPLAYLNALKMTRAKELLAATSMKVYTIAQRLGYETPHYFARLFQRYAQCTPHAYRESAKHDAVLGRPPTDRP